MNLDLKNKNIIITGGGGDLGFKIAETIEQEGANIFILDKKISDKRKLIIKKNSRLNLYLVDLSNEKKINTVFKKLISKIKKIDVLINNAGIFSNSKFDKINNNELDKMFNINFKLAFFCCKNTIKNMLKFKSGSIINISSLAGFNGGYFASMSYSTSKAAMNNLTKSLAKTYGQKGIRVNTISPGPLETQMTKKWPNKIKSGLKKNILINSKRLGKVEDVANVVAFLSSIKSFYIHGQNIHVNGGIVIY